MLVDGNFDAVIVASSALAKGARAAHEDAAAVAQLAIEGLDHARTRLAHDVCGRGQGGYARQASVK